MKAKSRKQIKNSLKKVNVCKDIFEREVIKTYGDIDQVKIDKCNISKMVKSFGECPIYIVYDNKEDGYSKTFRLAVSEYEQNNKCMMKVVEIIDI